MYIQELRVGEESPDDVDRIIITELPSGQFQLAAVIWMGSIQEHSVHQRNFGTAAEAKDAGIEWADECGAETLLIEYRNS